MYKIFSKCLFCSDQLLFVVIFWPFMSIFLHSSFDGPDEDLDISDEATPDGHIGSMRANGGNGNMKDIKIVSHQIPSWLSNSTPDEFIVWTLYLKTRLVLNLWWLFSFSLGWSAGFYICMQEIIKKSDAPLHVKYLQTMVECLCMLGKVAAAGAILWLVIWLVHFMYYVPLKGKKSNFCGLHICNYTKLVMITHVYGMNLLCYLFYFPPFPFNDRICIWTTFIKGSSVSCSVFLYTLLAWLCSLSSYTKPKEALSYWMFKSSYNSIHAHIELVSAWREFMTFFVLFFFSTAKGCVLQFMTSSLPR